MADTNGEPAQAPLDLGSMLTLETEEGTSLTFEVIGILEDPDAATSYAVLARETEDAEEEEEFIVTDLDGNLLEDDETAQEILDDFLAFNEEAADESEPS